MEPGVQCCIHNRSPIILILSQYKSVSHIDNYIFKIYSNTASTLIFFEVLLKLLFKLELMSILVYDFVVYMFVLFHGNYILISTVKYQFYCGFQRYAQNKIWKGNHINGNKLRQNTHLRIILCSYIDNDII